MQYVPVGMKALRLLTEQLKVAGHKEDLEGLLFRPVRNRVTGELNKPLHPVSVYQDIVKRYGKEVGITEDGGGRRRARRSKSNTEGVGNSDFFEP